VLPPLVNVQSARVVKVRSARTVKAGSPVFGDQVNSDKTQLLAFLTINWRSTVGMHSSRKASNCARTPPRAGSGQPRAAVGELF